VTDPCIVAGDREIGGALFDQSVDQRIRLADGAETAQQDDRAVLDACHGFRHGLDDLVDHAGRSLQRPASGRV